MKGLRKINVFIPEINKDGTSAVWKPMKDEDHMIHRYKCGQNGRMICLENKPPVWNPALNAYVLNFFGRVTKPSVKNFQLVNKHEGYYYYYRLANSIVMQFGRIEDEYFNLDIGWPFSIFQAFAIAISAFDYN